MESNCLKYLKFRFWIFVFQIGCTHLRYLIFAVKLEIQSAGSCILGEGGPQSQSGPSCSDIKLTSATLRSKQVTSPFEAPSLCKINLAHVIDQVCLNILQSFFDKVISDCEATNLVRQLIFNYM